MKMIVTKIFDKTNSLLEKLDKNFFNFSDRKITFSTYKVIKDKGIDLKELYRECGSEMRALRDTEFKITAIFYQMSAFLLAANIYIIANKIDGNSTLLLDLIFLVISVIFLTIFWLKTHERIAYDNASYGWHLALKRHIEIISFEVTKEDTFPGKPPNIGDDKTGKGYRKTQAIVAVTYVSLLLMIVLGHLIKILLLLNS